MSMLLAFPPLEELRPSGPPDWQAREQALDTHISCIVEAPAGSGKTGLLIQRYLKLLATADQPEEVLALTFTKKATAEMRDRVLTALQEAAESTGRPAGEFARVTRELARAAMLQDERRGWRMRERPHRLNIRTLDSLCGQLAQAFPLLGGGAGLAKPVADATELYARAAQAVLLRLGGSDERLNQSIETVLLHRDADLTGCEQLLAEMLNTRDQWSELLPQLERPAPGGIDDATLDDVVLPRLHEALRSAVCGGLTELHARFPKHALDELAAIAHQLAGAEGYRGEPSPYRPCSGHRDAPGTGTADVDRWLLIARLLLTSEFKWRKSFNRNLLKAEADRSTKARLAEVVQSLNTDEELHRLLQALHCLPPAEYAQEQWVVVKALLHLLALAVVELQAIFAREGVCDFAARALAAKAVLRTDGGPNGIAGVAGLRLKHLLVDEMQDTSSSQYELLEELTRGWDGASRTVFLVGDPKQSIYLFRQARVERFLRSMETGRLGLLPLRRLHLTANFRSGARLVSAFNEAFTAIFPWQGGSSPSLVYTPAQPVQPASEDEGWYWHNDAVPSVSAARKGALRRTVHRGEAEEIAAIAADWQAKPLPVGRKRPWQIAVLTRARVHVAAVTRALATAGIPFRAVEMEGLHDRQEVMDAVALTRALLHPADRTAWLAVLRAPWCGLGLADLHTVAGGDQPEHRRQALRVRLRERAALLAEEPKARLLRTITVLDRAVAESGGDRLAVWVERTWLSLHGDGCLGALERENVQAYFRLLSRMREPVDQRSLMRELTKLFAEPSHAPGAIDVMTIHKAKGLEWDVVLLPGLHRCGARTDSPLLDWVELPTALTGGRREVLLSPIAAKGEDPGALQRYIRRVRKDREEAELKRLFYVASTRARTALHLFASPEARTDGVIEPEKNTLLRAAWPAAAPEFAAPPHASWAMADIDRDLAAENSLDLAAVAENTPSQTGGKRRPALLRLPMDARLGEQLPHDGSLTGSQASTGVPMQSGFLRPDGSWTARALGNAVHTFTERLSLQLAQRLAQDASPEEVANACDDLLAQLPGWRGAVDAYLRANGIADTRTLSGMTLRALTQMLGDAEGRWILLPHPNAMSESAFTAVQSNGADARRVRLDRSFFAGAEPLSKGLEALWIVDLKTSDPKASGEEDFEHAERERYEPQLRNYAEIRLRSMASSTPVMLALYYPLLRRLIWWRYIGETAL